VIGRDGLLTMFESQYQSYLSSSDPSQAKGRVRALRVAMIAMGIDGFIVPHSDRHQNEYLPASEERLAWLTGFTGSAGTAIILADSAAIFVDGRYFLQVREQTDDSIFIYCDVMTEPPARWLSANLTVGARLGYDPWLHTADGLERLASAVEKVGASMIPMSPNPIDAIWVDRPSAPLGKVTIHDLRAAGESAESKISRVRTTIGSANGLFISDAHCIAWLFNIRGSDVGHTPLPLSYALLPKEGRPTLYIDHRKLDAKVSKYLERFAELAEPDRIEPDLRRAGARASHIIFDAATAPVRLVQLLKDARGVAIVASDPISAMKAVKNKREIAGSKSAHLRDAAAMVRFLSWFDREAPSGQLNEIVAAQALETFRRDTGRLREISFDTISAFGPNSAMPHYRVTEKTCLPIRKGIYLVDSGGQYEDGTTDITRTIAVGRPTSEMRGRFTLVLKGHIAIARAVFPAGVSGAQIDSFARRFLWEAGLDFDHGTGHGVGSYLSVHEGPQRIAKSGAATLEPGMIVSNEPGYYAAGRFGIRIENLLAVVPLRVAGGERDMRGFETLSLAPIDKRLINRTMLDDDELAWLNAYHARVRESISPLVDRRTQSWLMGATQPL
jgi:Xaa-Pro aminopeptidase